MFEDFRLKVFATAARCGSFNMAASSLGITQPAVSRHISELEKELNVRLFSRGRARKVELTPEGREFLKHCEEILGKYKYVRENIGVPKSLLFKGVMLPDGKRGNVLVKDGRYAALDAPEDTMADKIIDASSLGLLPAFYNTHNHAAMTLLRGYADDLPLEEWLNDYIWPFEDKLKPADIRRGSELAVREMLASGSVFFSDMYFDIEQTIKAVEESGMRAAIGVTVMENHSKSVEEEKMNFVRSWNDPTGGRIQLVMAPHAVYTVGTKKLKKCADFARSMGLKLHIHVSETRVEVENCLKDYGMTPVRYLDSIGLLGPDVIAAHCVHVDEEEWDILAKRGVTVAHCPCSNMKLGSGRFPYELAIKSGCRITVGTDGASSNNNLDMLEEVKFAALLAKLNGDPSLLPAGEIFRWATKNGAEAFGLDAGEIAVGKLADGVLVDLNAPRMQPCHNLVSNYIYSADSSVIRYVLCDGRIVFRNLPHIEDYSSSS